MTREATKSLDFKDTWHVAGGAQYRMSGPLVAEFRRRRTIPSSRTIRTSRRCCPQTPHGASASARRRRKNRTFNWGLSAEYAYGGTLDVNRSSDAPVALGGRGNLVGSYNNAGVLFLSSNFNWKF